MRLHKVKNPLLDEVEHADQHCIEEVGLREVAHATGNLSKQIQSSLNMARREISIGCLGVGIGELSIKVVIPPGVFLVRRDIMSKFMLWTLAPNTDKPLAKM